MSAEVKITTICENRASRSGLLGEHGLSMLLEVRGRKILFDTGAGATLAANASALELDLTALDAVVLSHGHYDHTGGLKWVLASQVSSALPVYAHPDALNEKYILVPDMTPRYIGVPWKRAEMEALGAEFRLSREAVDLGDGITITGEIPRTSSTEGLISPFGVKEGEGITEDRLYDDQALVVESSVGIIVMLGCSHSGLIDTLQHVLSITGERRIYSFLGGTHLLHTPDDHLERTVDALRQFQLELIAPCHCSGPGAIAAMEQAFGDRCLDHRAGSIFEFPQPGRAF